MRSGLAPNPHPLLQTNHPRPCLNPILFLTPQEAFGYIGSSAMAVDMKNGVFPTSSVGLNSARVQAFVELGQLMSGDTTDYRVFTYDSTPSPAVASTVQTLKDAAAAVDPTKANFVNSTATELPPASLRAFLYELSDATDKDNFPGVVVADHDTTFDNTRYHSLFDVGARYNITSDTTSDTTVCLGWVRPSHTHTPLNTHTHTHIQLQTQKNSKNCATWPRPWRARCGPWRTRLPRRPCPSRVSPTAHCSAS